MTLAPLGDCAMILTVGKDVDGPTLMRVSAVTDAIRSASIRGVIDVVPAFGTVTVIYDPAQVGAVGALEGRLGEIGEKAEDSAKRVVTFRSREIPVCYGGEHGPDLEEIARRAEMTPEDFVVAHAGAELQVQAIGFVPGFAYLAGLPRKLHTPRRATPRPNVPAGSVGIGGAQSGIYPVRTPAGWNIIGRTPLSLFDANRAEPALLRVGDRVTFTRISPEEFVSWK